ncbi:hypothetical protein [Alkalihalobacillus sp. 1P02AB]
MTQSFATQYKAMYLALSEEDYKAINDINEFPEVVDSEREYEELLAD